ncbi:MAG: serine hydroxymethyltransferase [Bacilli bacterium]|nr:serine hydroxymethyltransferase [Bacilli bacterium]
MNKKLKTALNREIKRQEENIELIASENYVSKPILKLQGSILTNKYAEGYPGKKYYGGCENIDTIENLAIDLACKLFGSKFANVQPHSGSSANLAVYKALLNHKDKVMGMDLSNGGHLTHGHPLNFSGLDYEIISYTLDSETELIDYEKVREIALKEKPRMIIAGASAYSRIIDFKKFKEIADEIGAYLFVDMAHIAGLVAAGIHPSPVGVADIVTTTTHKTLRGPRGGLILTNNEEIAKKIDRVVFPGIQGGPLMHVIAAKAQCFHEAIDESFAQYQIEVVKNSRVLAKTLKEEGFRIISDGTDNHMFLVEVKSKNLTGKEAEKILDSIHITVNKNTIPNDSESPFKTSGIRIGTPAMTTRGLKEKEFIKIGKIISEALKNKNDIKVLEKLSQEVLNLTKQYPIYKKGV